MRGDTKNNTQGRARICRCIFVLKATLAIILGLACLALQGNKARMLYMDSKVISDQELGPVVIDPSSSACAASATLARLETPDKKILLGFHLDWQLTTPIKIKDQVGFYPAVINAFLVMDPTQPSPIDYSLWDWHAQEVRRIGGSLMITVQPVKIAQITDSMIADLADRCLKINSLYGVPLFLRYGHEMNGDWADYGVQPTAYTASFQRVARAVHARTNMTAMVWGPNLGINYPYSGGISPLPLPGTPDFRLLDTDKSGVIDNKDDPYLPYYPGNEYVDWVGISLYWYPDSNTGYNVLPPPNYFRDMMTATGENMNLVNAAAANDPTRNFYQRFAVERNKPLMIPETSAPFTSSKSQVHTNPEIKAAWYNQIFGADVNTIFPKLKIVGQFEEIKLDSNNLMQDWRVLQDKESMDAFKTATNTPHTVFGNQFKFTCGGKYVSK